MSGDYSRWSFKAWHDFDAVLMQQGRVHTDADWNEWVAITLRRLQAETIDALGRAVVPFETPDGFLLALGKGGLTIGLGRAYVDGLLAENHGMLDQWQPVLAELSGSTPITYEAQPYLPGGSPALPAKGRHLAYLRVWQRERTAIELPELVEQALGVDTTTRLQTVWQVKLIEVGPTVDCRTPLEGIDAFRTKEPPAAGRLTTGTVDLPETDDPCIVPPNGGYVGLENQFYRVEIHRGGPRSGPNRATFKWSRDNATVAARVTAIGATLKQITVDRVGRDDGLSFHDGEVIEITDDWRELAGMPGEMCRIKLGGGVDGNVIVLDAALPANAFGADPQQLAARNTRVRRWDHAGTVYNDKGKELANATHNDGSIFVPGSGAVLLEHGLVVRFDLAQGGVFRSGDYWTFAARTVDASVEHLEQAPPRGIHAHYAPLAILTLPWTEATKDTAVEDCRTVFPPLGGLDALEYVAGDGQEATPDPLKPASTLLDPLPIAPTVGVARGPIRVAGRTVRFRTPTGGGAGTIDGSAPGTPVKKLTGLNGLVSVAWRLDSVTPVQRLVAELLDANGDPTSLPVEFSARLRTAAVVSYDPHAENCPGLANVNTVQDALDLLSCATALEYVAGEGQEVTPAGPGLVALPVAPTVGIVAHGSLPTAGTVRFTVLAGTGTLDGSATPPGKTKVADATGIVSVDWKLDPKTPVQRIIAELIDANGVRLSLPVYFSARLRTADVVAYDPTKCAGLAGVTNVQDAIDQLCGRSDCCAFVGPGGEFTDINAAIEELAKRHDGHVCICLSPEKRHRLETGKVGGLRSLTITGRGAVIELPKGLQLVSIDDVALRDVAFVEGSSGLTTLLDLVKCQRVEFATVSARLNLGTAASAVLRFDQCELIRVIACEIANVETQAVVERVFTREELPPVMRTFLETAERASTPAAARVELATLWTRPAPERLAAVAELGSLVERYRAGLGATSVATLEKLGSVMTAAAVPAAAELNSLLERVARLSPKILSKQSRTAIEFLDGRAFTWLERDIITGGIKLYPGVRSAAGEALEKTALDEMKAGRLGPFPTGVGRFRLVGTLVDWIALGEEANARLGKLLDGASDVFKEVTLFDELLIQGNTFRELPQFLMADAVTLIANVFEGQVPARLGCAFANRAVTTSNIGPGKGAEFRLYASDRGVAANAGLTIGP